MYLGLRRIARLLSGHGHPPAASEWVTLVFSPCFCSKMTNGDNKFGIYWLREREHCSLQLNGLQYNPYGRLCPVKARWLRLLLRMSDNTTLQTNKSVLFLSPDPLKEEHKCSSEQECFVLEYKKRSWCLDSAGNDSVMLRPQCCFGAFSTLLHAPPVSEDERFACLILLTCSELVIFPLFTRFHHA